MGTSDSTSIDLKQQGSLPTPEANETGSDKALSIQHSGTASPPHAKNDSNSQSPQSAKNDTSSLGSTISHLVGALAPSSDTTSLTHMNVTTSTSYPNKNDDKSSTLKVVTEALNDQNEKPTDNSIPALNEPKFHSTPVASIQSQPGIKFTPADELKASFTGISNKNTDPISMVLPPDSNAIGKDGSANDKPNASSGVIGGIGMALGIFNTDPDKEKTEDSNLAKNSIVKSSPLLSSTPPTVSKSLIRSYPFLILTLKALNVLTWNDDDDYLSIFLVLLASFSILYYEPLIIYFGHLLPVFTLWVYSECKIYVKAQQAKNSTLDDIIQTMTLISKRADVLISPIVELGLSAGDLKRLLFTTVFLSPVYVVISFFILPPNKVFLILTILILTYHSKWSRVTRTLLWKSRTFRLLCFYLTGLDFESSGLTKASTLFNLNKRLSNRFGKHSNSSSNNDASNSNNISKSSVRFTYVIYENQRRWLGVGWTPNLLSYERTPWTDEFLNESEPIESFELPQLPLSIEIQDSEGKGETAAANGEEVMNTKGMVWRWIDKTWRLDLTNDGSIQLPSTRPKTTANPKSDDGWIYYDNTWKNPTTEDGFSKYTRRRRWIRTAELVYIGSSNNSSSTKTEVGNNSGNVNKEVRISDDVSDLEKSTKFVSSDSISVDAVDTNGNEEGSHDDSNGKPQKGKKGGLKRHDEAGQTKKRKSLRFEEP